MVAANKKEFLKERNEKKKVMQNLILKLKTQTNYIEK